MRKFVLFILLTLSILSLAKGFKNALSINGSQDFQWSPTIIFLEKINPYEYFLNGNIEKKIILAQYPTYLHLTYILLIPFACFDWFTAKLIWCSLNIFISVFCSFFLCRRLNINIYDQFILFFLFLMSTPLRNSLGNGQHAILVLFFYSLILIKKKSFFVGISYFKYSFMPLISVFLLFKYGMKKLFYSFLPSLLGWIFFSIYLKENIFYTLAQPLKVAHKGFAFRLATGDIFTIINFFYSNKFFSYIIILFLIFVLTYVISKKTNLFHILSLLSVGSLMILPHLIYDYVLLLPALIYFWKNNKNFLPKIGILIILYFWFGLKFINIFFNVNFVNQILNLFLLSLLFYLLYKQDIKIIN